MSTSKNTDDELRRLSDKLNLYLDFLPIIVQGQFRQLVQNGVERKDLRGLRMVESDFKNWIKDITGAKRKMLNEVLREKFGEEIDDNSAELKRVDKILNRQIIKTKAEYRIVSEFVDEYREDKRYTERIDKANLLMNAFSQVKQR